MNGLIGSNVREIMNAKLKVITMVAFMIIIL